MSTTRSDQLSQYGKLSDGATFPGFLLGSQVGTKKSSEFGHEIASENDKRRFSDRSSGYAVQATETIIQQIFLKKGSFELEYAALC